MNSAYNANFMQIKQSVLVLHNVLILPTAKPYEGLSAIPFANRTQIRLS